MSECIEWTGLRNGHGYGRTWHDGKGVLAHRLAWMIAHGPIPDGLIVRHRCDNTSCIALDHLLLGTQADNLRDMAERGRGTQPDLARTHCANDHEFTPENTYYAKTKKGSVTMVCRRCKREAMRRARNVRDREDYLG